jgi:hypothetical protein
MARQKVAVTGTSVSGMTVTYIPKKCFGVTL